MKKVFVNGTFDVIHRGHLAMLNFAKFHGDFLLVGIDSDRRVKEMKGNERPFNDQETRKEIMENFKAVNGVKIFDSDEELINMIKEYEPDIMILGSDYSDERVIGSEYAKRLVFFERDERFSTTEALQSYVDRRRLL